MNNTEEIKQMMLDWETEMMNRAYFLKGLLKEVDELRKKVSEKDEEIRRLTVFNQMLLVGDMQDGGGAK